MHSSLFAQDVDEIQSAVDRWYRQSSTSLQASHASFIAQLRQLQERLGDDSSSANNNSAAHVDTMITPPRHMYAADDASHAFSGSPAMASPPISRGALNYDTLLDEVVGKSTSMPTFNAEEEALRRKRPNPESVHIAATTPPDDYSSPCQVLVEFKRKRMLQYESPCYIAPGEHVVVGGDRGEDIGLVTHTWTGAEAQHMGESRDKGVGKVLRVASVLEVTQLQGVQTELETRAVEVAQEKVQESGLPMRIVDAEYQFDRRKLTFYYQSMHRLDFRTLVRDLYKTFRARIWMEPDTAS
uniref:Sequence-specific RNA-binding protein n=1 Tax=Crithidia fasciculata TaxID=5656 RepID=Q643Z2_CRIFA|nr:sequence-specific RNA-binding protein [Crithidia fasciculata]